MNIRVTPIFILFCLAPALALDPDKLLSQYVFDVWTTDSGLPQNSVTGIQQGDKGYLWLATQEGLVRFDGVSFKVFEGNGSTQIKNTWINTLLIDNKNRTWLGGNNALYMVEGDLVTSFESQIDLDNDPVNCIFEDSRGVIWVGSNNQGLFRYHRNRMQNISTDNGLAGDLVLSIAEDSQGALWVATNAGLNRLKDGEFSALSTSNGLPSALVLALLVDKDTIWIGTDEGLCRLENGKIQLFKHPLLDGQYILSLYQDRSKNLWVATETAGLFRIHGDKVESATAQGFENAQVASFAEDREGSLWVGTFGAGLWRFRDSSFTAYSTREGLVNNTSRSVYAASDGSVWIATDGGLSIYKDGAFTSYTSENGLPGNSIRTFCEDGKGGMWISSVANGLIHFKDGAFTALTEADGFPVSRSSSLYRDSKGVLWVCSHSGLIRVTDDEITVLTTADGLASNNVGNVYEDRAGTLWVGLRGGGLNHIRDGKTGLFTTADGLSSNTIMGLYEDQSGNLWIGTPDGGLNRYDGKRFYNYSRRDGLFDDMVLDFIHDGDKFWVTANRGIYTIEVQQLLDYDQGLVTRLKCRSFGIKDGMKSAECNGGTFPSLARSNDGRLWFPTIQGVVSTPPDNLDRNALEPPVHIEELRVKGNAFDTTGALLLDAGSDSLEIHYTALSFSEPDQVRFRYRLEGHDSDWRDAGTRRVAYYTNLSPGTYHFKVIAANNDGIWNEKGDSLDLEIQALFYQKSWFRGLVLFCLILTGWWFHHFRLRRIRWKEEVLEKQVFERTRDLESANHRLLEAQEHVIEAAHRSGMAEIANNVFTQVEEAIEKVFSVTANLEHKLGPAGHPFGSQLRRLTNTHQDLSGYMDHQEEGQAFKSKLISTLSAIPPRRHNLKQELRQVLNWINQLTNIVSSQQEYVRMEDINNEVDINLLIADAIKLKSRMLREGGIEVIQDLQPLPPAKGHRLKLLNVLANLIQNGCESMQENSDGAERHLAIRSQKDQSTIIIEIEDTGHGIETKNLKRIFAQGFTTKNNRNGFGLHACANAMAEMSGRISAFSEGEDKGAQFRLEFRISA